MQDDDPKLTEAPAGDGVSRRDFLKLGGIGLAVPVVLGPQVVEAAGKDVAVYGPGKVPITLTVNGKKYSANVETRVTLLDVLRDEFQITGAKRVCDRGACGACTVLMDGKPVYACGVLAIEAQGKKITTIEGITQGEKLHPVQQAIIDNDGLQCGFCTPGFVVATKAMLEKYPHPTAEQVTHELSGNFCRCGSYHGLRAAIEQLSRRGA
jgi:xanthine dehydrogenase YagT iron-sulfur-binding subunit